MLEAIRTIGQAILGHEHGSASLVETLVDMRLLDSRGKKRGLIVTLDIQLEPLQIKASPRELDEKALMEVLWVGNARASNSPQDRLTTDNPEYLASQVVPNLIQVLPEGSLKNMLQKVCDEIYLDLGGKRDRYRYVWDLCKLGLADLNYLSGDERKEAEELCTRKKVEFLSREFLNEYIRQKRDAKKACELVSKVLKGWIAEQLKVKESQLKLYTLAVSGELLARHPDYIDYIERNLVDEVFEGSEAADGRCYLCGSEGKVTSNTTRFKLLKFYITDKPGFASRFRKNGFLHNYTLCKDCYRFLLAGERFVENRLRTRLGGSSAYIIPTFYVSEVFPDVEKLEGWAKYLTDRLAASDTLESWHKFQEALEQYQDFEEQKAFFMLNLLFVTKGQAAVKVDKLISEVPPSRLDLLDETRNTIRDWAARCLGEDARGEWDLSFGRLFYMLPLRKRDRQVETKLYLELLDALLTGRPMGVHQLIPQLLETACIHRFERYDQYAHDQPEDSGRELVIFLLQSQLFMRYLKELGQLNGLEGGSVPMTDVLKQVEQSAVSEDLRIWMDELGLDEVRRSLFLLGVLIGRIGSRREQRDSDKPILNKVHFQGMDRPKIVRLANEVYEKLRQYKIADYNEGLYAAMKAYLDRSLDRLGPPHENAYWVLSGYAWGTQQTIREGQLRKRAKPLTSEEGEDKAE